jgi:hypothetical protein
VVDIVHGNDGTASIGGTPYQSIEAAIAALNANGGTTGKTIWVLPGIYSLNAGITLPDGNSLRGMSVQTVTIQMLGVTANTTLVTMGENSRLEDTTLKLTSDGHHTLKGIVFGGTTTQTAKLRTCVLTVDNSAAAVGGTSTVIGIECNGTGALGAGTFSFNSLRGSAINVYSNGAGIKRGILVSNTNIVITHDMNIYIAQPTSTASTGSYVGIETNDANNTGSVQMRTTTAGVVKPTAGQSYTASDILQTTPAVITDPTYLASAGIQIGPGSDLVTKSAGGKGFSSYIYPATVYYGLKGDIKTGTSTGAYMWPGTQAVSNGIFPEPAGAATPPYYRVQQPSLISGLSVGLNTAAGGTASITVLVKYTPVTGTITDTPFTVTLGSTDLFKNFYSASVALNTGDKIHIYLTYTGNNNNTAHDLTVQLDMF